MQTAWFIPLSYAVFKLPTLIGPSPLNSASYQVWRNGQSMDKVFCHDVTQVASIPIPSTVLNSIWSLMSTTVMVCVLIKLFPSDLLPQSPLKLCFQHWKVSLAFGDLIFTGDFSSTLQTVWEQLCHSPDSFATPLDTYSISVTFSQKDILITTPKESFSKLFETDVLNILKLTYWQWITLWKWESTKIYLNGATSIPCNYNFRWSKMCDVVTH
jgi:hypothetical protein